jgi:CRISPR-associated protein Cas1
LFGGIAILNYLYAILEAETVVAVLGARLDPALGFLHADRTDRPSLARDLMEPIRPSVDLYGLSMLRERQFT